MSNNIIPAMTHPLGKHWRQPPRSDILIDDIHALMGEETFHWLAEYSASIPTGVYSGKMWKCFTGRKDGILWLLKWYSPSPDQNLRKINYRDIILIN